MGGRGTDDDDTHERHTEVGGRLVLVVKNGGFVDFASRLHPMADGRPRITVTSARTATASLVERRGEGVDRRAAHQGPLAGERLAREVTERQVERRSLLAGGHAGGA